MRLQWPPKAGFHHRARSALIQSRTPHSGVKRLLYCLSSIASVRCEAPVILPDVKHPHTGAKCLWTIQLYSVGEFYFCPPQAGLPAPSVRRRATVILPFLSSREAFCPPQAGFHSQARSACTIQLERVPCLRCAFCAGTKRLFDFPP